MHSIDTKNPYKSQEEYFCECPNCKEHRKISKNTFYAMNRKANPVSKRCMKCFGLDKRIDKEYKLQCNICNNIFEVSSGQMVRYRKLKKYMCCNCNHKTLAKRGLSTRLANRNIPWNKSKGKRTKEDIRVYKLKWKYNNIDRVKENWNNYYKENYEQIILNSRLSSHTRRCKLKYSKLTKDMYYLLILSTDTCTCCKKDLLTNKFEIDHIIPIKNGGTNNIENLQLLCISCNRKKHTKSMDEFKKDLELLNII